MLESKELFKKLQAAVMDVVMLRRVEKKLIRRNFDLVKKIRALEHELQVVNAACINYKKQVEEVQNDR